MHSFRANMMNVNAHKTRLICFHNPFKKVKLTQPLFLQLPVCCPSCNPVKYVSAVKYLGLYFEAPFIGIDTSLVHVKNLCCITSVAYMFIMFLLWKVIVDSLCYSLVRYGISKNGHHALRLKKKKKNNNSILHFLLRTIAMTCINKDAYILRTLLLPDFDSLLN